MGRYFLRTSLIVFALGWGPSVAPAHADSFVIAKATLDWTGFTFSVSDGLTIDEIVFGFLGTRSNAATSDGGARSATGSTDSAAVSSYLNTLGSATATSEVSNGALTSISEAASVGGMPTINAASSDVFASTSFFLYGSGQGELTVEVPYELMIQTVLSAASNDIAKASASVSLELGPGAGWFASDSLSWDSSSLPLTTGPFTKTGTLTLSRFFQEPRTGPLVFIGAGASTEAVTAVPEPATLALLGFGAASLLWVRRKKK